MFAVNLIGLGFLQSVSYTKSIPTHENYSLWGKKSGPNATFDLFFLGLGWPWVGGSSSVSQQHFYVFQPNIIW